MTVYCAYARPNSVNQIHLHDSNKKRADFHNLSYLKAGEDSANTTTDKFQGVWYSNMGMGSISDSKYAYVNLKKKGYGSDEICADLVVKDFGFDIPLDAKIRRFGVVFSAKTENSSMVVHSPVIRVTSLPAKDLHKIYSNKDVDLFTNKDYNKLEAGMVGSKQITTKKRNIAFTYDVTDTSNTLKPSELNKSSFQVKIEFGANEGKSNGQLLVDAVGVYVEYETPEYSLINTDAYDETDPITGKGHRTAVVNEETIHHIQLKHNNDVTADTMVTKLRIPSCMTVTGADVSKGDFDIYRTGEYSNTFIPMFRNPSELVMRGSYFKVQLVDTTNNNTPIPFVNVTFKFKGKLYTSKTNHAGWAILPIRVGKGEHGISYSFNSEFYQPCMGSKKFMVKHNRELHFLKQDGDPMYENRRDTVISRVEEVKNSGVWQNVSNTVITAIYKEILAPNTYGKTYTFHATSNDWGRAVFKLNLPLDKRYLVQYKFEESLNDDLCKDEYDIFDGVTSSTREFSLMGRTYDCFAECGNQRKENEGTPDEIAVIPRHGTMCINVKDDLNNNPMDSEVVAIRTTRIGVAKDTAKTAKSYTDRNGNAWFKIDYGSKYPIRVQYRVVGMDTVNGHSQSTHTYPNEFRIRTIEPTSNDDYNYKWVVNKPDNEYLNLHLVPKKTGECEIDLHNTLTGKNTPYYYNNHFFKGNDDIQIYTTELHRNTKEYIEFSLRFNPSDYNHTNEGAENEDIFLFSHTFSNIKNIFDWENIEVVDDSSANVRQDNCIRCYVEDDVPVMYVRPTDGGEYFAHCKLPVRVYDTVTDIVLQEPTYNFCIDIVGHTGGACCQEIWILDKLPYRITGKRVKSQFTRHSNQLNQGDWGEYVLNCTGSKENYFDVKEDFRFTVTKPRLFIGMVELHRSHMSPTAEDSQTLLERQYKDRRILRKKGDYKHNVETVLRLPPSDLATINAMSRLDMPFPAHFANVPSWNPLTVHGWIDLYQVSDQKEINSNLYEAKLEWEYLTRKLYSLMTIKRNKSKVSSVQSATDSFDVVFYPEYPVLDFFTMEGNAVLLDSYKESEELEDDYVDVGEEKVLDMAEITVTTGNKLKLTSKYALPNKCRVSLNWKDYLPSKTNDYLDNFVRIIRLFKVNEDGLQDTVFEYTYTDFEHYGYSNEYAIDTITNESKVNAIAMKNDEVFDVANERIVLDYDEDYTSETTYYVDSDDEPNYTVGSKFVLTLKGSSLSFVDEGHSGNELEINDIDLDSGEYFVEIEMTNQAQLEYEDLVWESLLNVQVETDDNNYIYSKVYDDTIVSPAPLSDNVLMYTRLGEDGMVYYYKYNSNKTYKYRGDPYNPYINACNVETIDGVSMFDCNNDYDPVCLQNGIVKVALHRYNGVVEFFKWKADKQEWISTFVMRNADDNSNMSIAEYSTDRISVKWGRTLWTIWRGRPFIDIYHPKTVLMFVTKPTTVYCDLGEDMMGEFDVYHNRNLYGKMGNNKYLDVGMVSVSAQNVRSKTPSLSIVVKDEDGNPLTLQTRTVETQQCEIDEETGDVECETITYTEDYYTIKADGKIKFETTILDENNAPMAGATLYLLSDYGEGFSKDGVQLLTDANGKATFTRQFEQKGEVKFQIAYYGNVTYNPVASDEYLIVIADPRKTTDIDATFLVSGSDKTEVAVGSEVTITGTLRKDYSMLWQNQTITLKDSSDPNVVVSEWSNTDIISEKADTGEYIEDINVYYALSSSDAEATGDYQTTVPTLTSEYPYMWSYKEIEYDNGVVEETVPEMIVEYVSDTILTISEEYALCEYLEQVPSSFDTLENINSSRLCGGIGVSLYFDNELEDTTTSDEYGEFSFTYTLNTVGIHRLIVTSAKTSDLKSDTEDHSYWVKTEPTMTVSHDTVYKNTETPVTGTISWTPESWEDDENDIHLGWIVTWYVDNIKKGTTNTNDEGEFGFMFPASTGGSHTLKITAKPNRANSTVLSTTYIETVDVVRPVWNVSLTSNKDSYELGETVTLTATVLDDEDVPLSGRTVTFKHGDTTLTTATTNSNGVATCDSYVVDTLGTNYFSALCEDKGSESVSVTVEKITPNLTITGGGTYTLGDTVTFSGSLVSGSQGIGNAELLLFDVASLSEPIGVITTSSNGTYSYSFTPSSIGITTYFLRFLGDATHKSQSTEDVTVTVNAPPVGSVSLSSTKSSISAYDSEVTELTVYVKNYYNQPVSGAVVTFYKGDTSIGNATTNQQGYCAINYTAVGDGDISFKAVCMNVDSNTVTVEDCYRYDPCSSDKSSSYSPVQIDSRDVIPSFSFSTDHYVLSSTKDCFSGFELSDEVDNIEISVEFKASSTSNFCQAHLGYFNGTESKTIRNLGKKIQTWTKTYSGSDSGTDIYTNSSYLTSEYWRFKLQRKGNNIRFSFENLSGTELAYSNQTITSSQNGKFFVGFLSGSRRDVYIRNIKVKKV